MGENWLLLEQLSLASDLEMHRAILFQNTSLISVLDGTGIAATSQQGKDYFVVLPCVALELYHYILKVVKRGGEKSTTAFQYPG